MPIYLGGSVSSVHCCYFALNERTVQEELAPDNRLLLVLLILWNSYSLFGDDITALFLPC